MCFLLSRWREEREGGDGKVSGIVPEGSRHGDREVEEAEGKGAAAGYVHRLYRLTDCERQ